MDCGESEVFRGGGDWAANGDHKMLVSSRRNSAGDSFQGVSNMRILRYLRLAAPLVLLAPVVAAPAPASAAVFVSVAIAPPALPVYVQPPMPGPGYIWTPGYWGYATAGYYWVPGTWVLPPAVGLLWTPGYWGFVSGAYIWHAGYWGPHIGFYGGVNYGFGYFGTGFAGGYWQGGHYYYNSAYNNFGHVHVTNVYNRTVINENVNHVSYNGGPGGINRQATAEEHSAERDHHVNATSMQSRHEHLASNNPDFRHSVNHGNPTLAATSHAGRFGSANTSKGTGSKGTGGPKTVSGAKGAKSGPGTHGHSSTGTGPHPQSHAAPHSAPKGGSGKGNGEHNKGG